ncbi:hypothetical protein AGMMS49928_03040 [Spirochaetia bacterium]|nr:hypothetical protein AGMMS49928_03040 [Spirochaetia bacterium]
MKKIVFLVLGVAICAASVFAGGKGSGSQTGGTREVTFIIYGDKTDRMTQFMANDMPKLLAEKGLNIKMNLQVQPWTEYASSQIELRYASGEDFATWTDMPFIARCAGKGYLYDITDLIPKYAQSVLREIDKASFDSFSLNGRNYGLPIGNIPNASVFFAVTARTDLMAEVGITDLKTLDDVEKFYTTAKKLHPDYMGVAEGSPTDTYGMVRMLSRYISDKNLLFLNELVITDASANNAQIWSYLESDEFKKYAAIARRWNQMGIIDPQVLSDGTIANSKWLASQAMFRNGNAGRPWEEVGSMKAQNPKAALRSFFVGDAKGPLVSRGTYSTAFQISVNAKHPEAYLEVINLLYSDQKTYNYMTYGIEGTDYTLNAQGKIATRPNLQVIMPEWASNNAKWQIFEGYIDNAVINDYLHWNDGSILQKDIGFIFDLEPVKVEYAQIQAVTNEYVPPITYGFVNYDTAYPELLRRLKAAGIDKYMAEFQKQFNTWYSTKK